MESLSRFGPRKDTYFHLPTQQKAKSSQRKPLETSTHILGCCFEKIFTTPLMFNQRTLQHFLSYLRPAFTMLFIPQSRLWSGAFFFFIYKQFLNLVYSICFLCATHPPTQTLLLTFKWSSKSAAIPQGSTPVETALLLCSSCEGRESRNQRILLSIWIPQNTPSSREFSKVAHVGSSPHGISKKHCRSCWRYTEFCFQILKIETHHIYLTVLCLSLPERVSPSDILYDSISGFLGALWLKEWVFPSS